MTCPRVALGAGVIQLWGLLTLLGLVGPSVGLQPGLLLCEMELNCLAVDETLGVVYLGAVGGIYQLLLGRCLLKCGSLPEGTPTKLATVT